jgi:hypothetical protein
MEKICLVISIGADSCDISDHADFTRHLPIAHPRIKQSTTAMYAVLHAFYTPLALGSNLHEPCDSLLLEYRGVGYYSRTTLV